MRRSLLVLLAFGCLSACAPEAPTGVTTSAPLPPPPDLRGATVYDRSSPSMYANGSRFVLYADGTFHLQFPQGEYPGTYSRSDSTIAFRFVDSSVAGRWLADGIVRGDTLVVQYNDIMSLSDFENGAYVRP